MPALRPVRAAVAGVLLAVALLVPAAPSEAHTVRSFSAKSIAGGVGSFRLKGLNPSRISRAEVRSGRERRRVSLERVRRGARKGIVRLRLDARLRRSAKKPKLVVVVKPAPVESEPAPEPAPAPADSTTSTQETSTGTTTPAPAPAGKITEWRPVGSPPLTDAQAAALVSPAPEIRPANEAANRYRPSDEELAAFHGARYQSGPNAGALGDAVIPPQRHVTGRFAGTTDEILQWAAHKWGIPEDILRAVAQQESTWTQSAMGDRKTVSDSSGYPAHSRISATEAYESLGLMQIKWRPDGSLHPGTEPLRWKSTAFNVDFYGAVVRFYYDGTARSWFSSSSSYGSGQAWESVGAWYQPTPWRNSGQLAYIDKVKAKVAARAWEQPGF